jgi:hypothetical protein
MAEQVFTTQLETEWFGEISADVHFDYEAAEKMEPNPDSPWFGPGCAECATINDVVITINGTQQSMMSLVPDFYVSDLEDRALAWLTEEYGDAE